MLHLATESRKSPVLTIFLLFLSFIPLFSLPCLVLCHSFSPSFSLIYHRYSGICPRGAAGGAERCKVHFCPPVRACGPRGAPSKGPGQFYCPNTFQPMKDMVERVLGAETGGGQSLSWGSRVYVCVTAQIASPLLLLPPCPVLSCP